MLSLRGALQSHPCASRASVAVFKAITTSAKHSRRLSSPAPSNFHNGFASGRTELSSGLTSSLNPDLFGEDVKLSKSLGKDGNGKNLLDALRVYLLIRNYQTNGFLHADLDPLNLPRTLPYVTVPNSQQQNARPDYKTYGFTEADLDKEFDCRLPAMDGFLSDDRKLITLRQLIKRLEETYCGTIGVEFRHISEEGRKIGNFMRTRLETPEKPKFSDHMRRRILIRTMRAQLFENFCYQKFPTTKRFGLDGCEAMIVTMKEIAKNASEQGVDNLIVGMSHRGRLNLLMNVMHKPFQQIVAEFRGLTGFGVEDWGLIGDVKYHMGFNYKHWDIENERFIHMSVLPNPSHLETISPLVVGNARARQYYTGDEEMRKTLPVVFHGDASVAGQGIVYETLQMSKLPAYNVGGTIHIVVNNQIGFTTNVMDSGSGQACTSIARAVDAPVFHVNADDPEAATYVAQMALDYRQKFGGDVFINIVGYRRFGHNELDMPRFTQPRMYEAIAGHPRVLDVYAKRLIDEGVIDQAFFDQKKKETLDYYEMQYAESKTYKPSARDWEYTPQWRHMARPGDICPPRLTGVPVETLMEIGKKISTLPKDFRPHPTLGKLYQTRLKALETGKGVDFGLGEALAYATLLSEGFHVRLVGQDCQRGTFSHRHAVLHDQADYNRTYTPLNELESPHKFEVYNSLLSEYAAMGFEFGYAMENPNSLVIWEAQFGDFANGAQVIIDQFIASAEVKWTRQNGIVLLLPHGYDGMGPEHSSARIERFLQLCDDREEVIHPENWNASRRSVIQKHNFQVVNPSTPSQHFHVLRRQQIRGFRKPLVLFSPKKLLKLRAAVSDVSELTKGTRFHRYIPNIDTKDTVEDKLMKRVVFCTGQLYYDLVAQRDKLKCWNVAIVRVEQLSPFPFDIIIDDLKRYPNLQDIVWAQEEPMNQGAWFYVSRRLTSSLTHLGNPNEMREPIYAGRDVSACPAAGDATQHNAELNIILRDAFDLNRSKNSYYENYMGTSG